MKAPIKVLLCWLTITIVLVVIVFYRYDLISGIKRTMQATNSATEVTKEATPPSTPVPPTAPAAAQANTDTVSTTSLANGKKVYEEKTCVLCHGATGKADTPTGLAMKSTNLTLGKFNSNTDNMEPSAYILKVIENGVPGTAMVSFKSQIPNEQDRKDLAAYVHSLAGK